MLHNEHYKHCGIDEFLWQATKIYDIIHIVFYGYTSCKLTGINLLIIKKRALSRYPSCLIYWDKILNLSEICHMEKDFAVFFSGSTAIPTIIYCLIDLVTHYSQEIKKYKSYIPSTWTLGYNNQNVLFWFSLLSQAFTTLNLLKLNSC